MPAQLAARPQRRFAKLKLICNSEPATNTAWLRVEVSLIKHVYLVPDQLPDVHHERLFCLFSSSPCYCVSRSRFFFEARPPFRMAPIACKEAASKAPVSQDDEFSLIGDADHHVHRYRSEHSPGFDL